MSKCLKEICNKKNVNAPILKVIYSILYEGLDPLVAMQQLMTRDLRGEQFKMPKKLCKVKNSKIHGIGMYAITDIKAEADIIEYTGEKITKKESTRRALEWEEHARETGEGLVYIFELDDKYDIDGRLGNNPARYMNHSCDPNCEAINREGEIWIVAVQDIHKGEELVYDLSLIHI